MSEYLLVKWVHVVSSTLLFGLGLGSAFYLFVTRKDEPKVVAAVIRRVVLADWLFTTPTAILQPLTGAWLVHLAGFPWTSAWILWSIALYAVAGACWVPVVGLQVRMARLAEKAAREGAPLPPQFWRLHAAWTALGWPAFGAFLVIFWLMVAKPA